MPHTPPRAGQAGRRLARTLLAGAGIADEPVASAVFTASTAPGPALGGWVLADLASSGDPPGQRPARVLVAVGSHAVYGVPLPRWGRTPTGPPFLLDPATVDPDPPIRHHRATMTLHDPASGTLIRLTGGHRHRAAARATLAAIHARTPPSDAEHSTGPAP